MSQEQLPHRRRRPEPWKRITAWCPVCHYHETMTFHEAATAEGVRPTFERAHLADRAGRSICETELRIEMPKNGD
jgi:hypothetical protein